MLVGPNGDAHAFEPKPAHAKAILQSRLFVINGLNFEPWAQKLAQSANYKGQTLVASQGIKVRNLPLDKGHKQAETDPHGLSLIHISEPTRLGMISYAVF